MHHEHVIGTSGRPIEQLQTNDGELGACILEEVTYIHIVCHRWTSVFNILGAVGPYVTWVSGIIIQRKRHFATSKLFSDYLFSGVRCSNSSFSLFFRLSVHGRIVMAVILAHFAVARLNFMELSTLDKYSMFQLPQAYTNSQLQNSSSYLIFSRVTVSEKEFKETPSDAGLGFGRKAFLEVVQLLMK